MARQRRLPNFEFGEEQVVQMAASIFSQLMLSAAGNGKTPAHHARRAIAIATAFAEVVNADTFMATSQERFAQLS